MAASPPCSHEPWLAEHGCEQRVSIGHAQVCSASAVFRLESAGECQIDVLVVSERVDGAAAKLFPIK